MASHGFKGIMGACAAGALLFSSTSAIAATPAPAPQVNPWAVLTAMSGGAPAAAMCGAAAVAAAAQAPGGCVLPALDVAAAPPPPEPVAVPPVDVAGPGLGISPVLLGLLALAAGVGLYLALRNDDDEANSPS